MVECEVVDPYDSPGSVLADSQCIKVKLPIESTNSLSQASIPTFSDYRRCWRYTHFLFCHSIVGRNIPNSCCNAAERSDHRSNERNIIWQRWCWSSIGVRQFRLGNVPIHSWLMRNSRATPCSRRYICCVDDRGCDYFDCCTKYASESSGMVVAYEEVMSLSDTMIMKIFHRLIVLQRYVSHPNVSYTEVWSRNSSHYIGGHNFGCFLEYHR